jgi:plasmid stabilization system protein ParE
MSPAALAPRARRDLLAAIRWIAADNPTAARRPPLILRILHGARDLPELLRGLTK